MQPTQMQTPPAPRVPTGQTSTERMPPQNRSQAAGVPVWGVLLILVGVLALLGNFGIGVGWILGLALGAWLVYLGVRKVPEAVPINWWLVGFGLLVGLGAISTGFAFTDTWVFPMVLVLVGLGILGEYVLGRQTQNR